MTLSLKKTLPLFPIAAGLLPAADYENTHKQELRNYSVFTELPQDFNPRFKAVGCFCEYEDKLLLLHRQPWKTEPNVWGIPGGKIDDGEESKTAVIREVLEETGLDINHPNLEEMRTHYIRLPKFHFTFHMFRIRFSKKPDIVLAEKEHQAYKWCTSAQAVELPLITGEIESFEYYDEYTQSQGFSTLFQDLQ